MAARLLDGVAVATAIRAEVAPAVAAFTAKMGRPPGLGIVLVGNDPASEVYVGSKLKSAGEAGLRADLQRLPADASLADLMAVVDGLNRSDTHDGILVQSPLPDGDGRGCGAAGVRRGPRRQGRGRIPSGQRRPARAEPRDARGLHAVRRHRAAGTLADPRSRAARAVVIGRSDIVGKPMALLLLHRHATVTICHSKTPNLPQVAAEADILVAAIGRAGFVTRDFVKPGATVVDVGTTPVTDRAVVERMFAPGSKRLEAFAKRGQLVIGDVHPNVAEVAGALSPVPGGVGPLTIALLLRNTLLAAQARSQGR